MRARRCLVVVCLVLGTAAQAVHSEDAKQEKMEPTITNGKQVVEHANLAGSEFHDVNLAGAVFNNVNLAGADFDNINLSKTRMHDINLSDLQLSAVNLGGARFSLLGPAPDKDGKQARQRPVTFEEAMLCDSTFTKVDLSGVKIKDCVIEGMTIDGILVTDLIAAYKKQHK